MSGAAVLDASRLRSKRTDVGKGDVRFAGYAAVFDRVDHGGDVVRPGAFAGVAAGVPLLWQHLPGEAIGTVERVEEDARGLRVIGRVSGRTSAGRAAARALKERAVDGLSFGYRVREARGAGPRELLALGVGRGGFGGVACFL